MSVDITTTATVSFGNLNGRLNDVERRVLAKYGKLFLNQIRVSWDGWTYKGRPAKAPRNVSFKAWKQKIDSREGGRPALLLSNQARDWRTKTRAYVAYVHRAGSTMPEWPIVWADVRAQLLQPMAVDLAAEISRNLMQKRPPTVIRKTGTNDSVVATKDVI